MRGAAVPIALVASVLVAACQSSGPSTSPPIPAPGIVYRVDPPVGPRPSKDDTSRAVDVFSGRLRTLGIGTFTAAAGDAITFEFPAPVSDSHVRAVLSAPGQVSFVPLGPPGDAQPVEGQPVPGNRPALFEGDQIASAALEIDTNNGPTVAIRFKDAGARSFAVYTSTHIGESFAIVIDGRMVAVPIVTGAITDGAVTISMPTQHQTIPVEVLAALLASGPLPPAWQHAAVSRP